MAIDAFVSDRCKQLGLSLTLLASRSGLTRMHLHRLMSGQVKDPGIRTLHALAGALRLPPSTVYRLFLPEINTTPPVRHYASRAWPNDAIMIIGDRNIPDHSVVQPGEQFTKTWAIQNVGQQHWPKRLLVRQDQELLVARRDVNGDLVVVMDTHLGSLGSSLDLPETPPGHVIELPIAFVAPRENCTVASIWRIENDQGEPVYPDAFFLQVIVTVLGG